MDRKEKETLVKGLRDMFRRKSACEGQITETLVLTKEIANRIDEVDYVEAGPLKDLLEFLDKRRQDLWSQILPIDQEIEATKEALKGTDY